MKILGVGWYCCDTKNFDMWNKTKKNIDNKFVDLDLFFHEREIWWCNIGLNIGVEVDGKNYNFERPVLIIKKFNGKMLWILALTTKGREDFEYHYKLEYVQSWVILSQIKTISTKRLLRKICTISEADFTSIKQKIIKILTIENPSLQRVSSEA